MYRSKIALVESAVEKEVLQTQDNLVRLLDFLRLDVQKSKDWLSKNRSRLSRILKQIESISSGSSPIQQWVGDSEFPGKAAQELDEKVGYLTMKLRTFERNAELLEKGLPANLGNSEWAWFTDSTREAAEELASLLRGFLHDRPLPVPENFEHQGFRVLNPEALGSQTVEKVLAAINRILDLFARRHMSKLLRAMLQRVVILNRDPTCQGEACPAGHYIPRKKEIRVYAENLNYWPGRLMGRWIDEVFLHEFGHMVHLDYLTPDAKAYWDRPWSEAKVAPVISMEDRARFLDLLRRNRGNVGAVSRKLNGLEKLKWLATLYMIGLVKDPLQPGLTKDGSRFVRTIKDTRAEALRVLKTRGQENPTESEVDRVLESVKSRLLSAFGLRGRKTGEWGLPTETQRAIAEEVTRRIEEGIGFPSDYSRTNEKEDFAENFVDFISHPERMPETRLYRMKRTLWLSGFSGKPVVRLGKPLTSRRARLASSLTQRYALSLVSGSGEQ